MTFDEVLAGVLDLLLARTHKERGHEAWALRLLGEVHASGESPDAVQAVAMTFWLPQVEAVLAQAEER